MSSNIKLTKTCLYCGNQFTAQTLHTRYCSHACNRKHYKQLKREEKITQYQQTRTSTPSTSTDSSTDFTVLQQKLFLSIDETAQLLGASRRTIQRVIAKGGIKVVKLGSRSIIQRTEIDKLFK